MKKKAFVLAACLLAGLCTACGDSSASEGVVFKAGEYHAKAGDKHFPVTIEVENSPGFSLLGLRVYYGEGIKPCKTDDKLSYEYKEGPMSDTMLVTCMTNDFDVDNVSFAGISGDGSPTGSGNLVTFYFKIPEDAEPGTQYEIRPETANIMDADSNNVYASVVIGHITVDE